MKRLITLIVSTIIICGGALHVSAVAVSTPAAASVATSPSGNEWIEVGEVTMVNWKHKYRSAILYAYYLGDRMLYKISYNGKMYGVTKNERYNQDERKYDYTKMNAKVTIDNVNWYLNVPNW